MRRSLLVFALTIATLTGAIPRSLSGQAVQAIRSIGRTQDEANADSVARAAGELTAKLGVLRATQALLLQADKPELAGYATLVGDLERLGAQALDRRDDPREFVRRLNEYNRAVESLAGFERRAQVAIEDVDAKRVIEGLNLASADDKVGVLVAPPAVFQYVPAVVFTTGLGVTSRFNDKYAFPLPVSTNLLGQLGGTVLGAFGDNALARYVQDNVVVAAILHAGSAGKPSGQLTLGLGEVHARSLTFWPVLGLEQTDTADSRVPRSLIERRATVSSWSTPLIGVAFTWRPLKEYVDDVKKGAARPLISAGVRFPYYYPGNSVDALAALFSDKISRYDRASHEQFFVAIDVPLLKVDPSRILGGK